MWSLFFIVNVRLQGGESALRRSLTSVCHDVNFWIDAQNIIFQLRKATWSEQNSKDCDGISFPVDAPLTLKVGFLLTVPVVGLKALYITVYPYLLHRAKKSRNSLIKEWSWTLYRVISFVL